MTVAITGAAGDVGRVVTSAFEADEHRLLTHSEHDDVDSKVLEMTDRDAFVDALAGADALVHLAWGPAGDDAWDDDHEANVRGTYTALEAARAHDLDRVVLASSNHVTGMYNRDDPTAGESMVADATTAVGPDDPVRPDSYYGVAKVASEAMGRLFADRHGIEVVVLRIGWVMGPDELRETQSDAAGRARFARAMWLSPRDCRELVRRAVHEPIETTPLVLNAVSRNAERYLSLTDTMLHLDYRPRDDASEVLEAN